MTVEVGQAIHFGIRCVPMNKVLYNVTVSVSEDVHEEWLRWMKAAHIPDVLGTGCFESARLLRVHAFEQGGITYAVMYTAPSIDAYERYTSAHAPRLRAEHESKFNDKAVAFRTMLEVLEEFSPSIN